MLNKIKCIIWIIPISFLLIGCPERDPKTNELLNDRGELCHYPVQINLDIGSILRNSAKIKFLEYYDLPQKYQIYSNEYHGSDLVKITILDQNNCVIGVTSMSREEYIHRIGLKNIWLSY